jgi:ribonuclease P protein component
MGSGSGCGPGAVARSWPGAGARAVYAYPPDPDGAVRTPSVRIAESAHRPATSGAVRASRLRRSPEFERVRKRGRRLAGEWLVVHVLRTEGPTRVGFVAGRGVGGAVERNRARRVLKEAWRALAPRAREGNDVLLVARPRTAEAGAPQVFAEMERLLTMTGVVG